MNLPGKERAPETVARYPFVTYACSRGQVHTVASDDLAGAVALTELVYEQGYCSWLRDELNDDDICGGIGDTDCVEVHCFQEHVDDDRNLAFWHYLTSTT